MKELINLRKPREKHYCEADGTIRAYVYDEDVHYLKDGVYREIDNTIVEGKHFYENKDNNFKVRFPKNEDTALYEIEEEDYNIKFSLAKSKSDTFFIETEKSTLFMKNLTEHLDARYDIKGSRMKESLILKSYMDEDVEFVVDTDVKLELLGNKIYGKKEDKTLFQFDVPYMVSSSGVISNEVHYDLSMQEGKYILSLKLDHDWLRRQDYPVTIDPSITGNIGNLGVYDTFIFEGDELVDRNTLDYLKVGVSEDNKIYRTLVKFNLPVLGTASQVISASATLFSHPMDYIFASSVVPSIEEREPIAVHEVTSSWTEESANWNSMHDKFSEKMETYTKFLRCEREIEGEQKFIVRANSMDITNLVKKWYAGSPNNGLMIKYANEVYNPNCKEYYMFSKNNLQSDENNPRPLLTVHYREQGGLLGYMSYNSLEFKNGTSYINLYNGNITNVLNVNETIAGKFPASLKMVYNTNDDILNLYKKGWRFSLEEKLNLETIDEKEYIRYLDSTSNMSYFYKVEKPEDAEDVEGKYPYYQDENGQNLKIKLLDNTYVLKDKDGNEKHFTLLNGNYVLSKIVDVSKNEINLTYDSQSRLIKVTDANNQTITVTYTDSLITVTTLHKTTKIFLNENGVEKIVSKEGETTFEYSSSGSLVKIKDTNGLGLKYEYYLLGQKVKKVEELGLNNSAGKSFIYEYGYNTTTVTDEKNHRYVYTFNNQGNTLGTTIMDEFGRLRDSYGYNQRFVEANGSNLNNKKTSETAPMKFADTVIDKWSFGNTDTMFSASGGGVTSGEARTNGLSYKGQNSKIHEDVLVYLNGLLADDAESITDITISGYVKNTKPVTVDLGYMNSIQTVPVDKIIVPASDGFTRFSFTCGKPESADQPIILDFSSDADYYLADFQVDRGIIASPFNIVDNPDFKDETLGGWVFDEAAIQNGEVERVALPSGEYALKFNSKPDTTINATYPVNYAGKKGDVYNLSFWYKNEGVLENEYEFVGNAVTLQFLGNDELEGAGTWNAKLNLHDTKWQFFSESFVAENDYTNFNLNVMSMFEANSLYITDIMLVKEMGQFNFSYDSEGNVISMADLAGNKREMTYDSKNQLLGAFTPKGNRFSYEYDNTIASRVLKGISPTGISNEIEYDAFGNPIKTAITNANPDGEIVDGKDYYMRLKGTKKYVDYDFDNDELILKENDCNHKTFKMRKIEIPEDGTYYRLEFLNKYLAVYDDKVILQSTIDDATLFQLNKKVNGSFAIIPKSKQSNSLACKDGKMTIAIIDEEDFNGQFYFEDFGTDKLIETTATYTEDGRFITSKTDALLKTVTYDIDPVKGLVNSLTDAKGDVTNYTYNDKDQITSILNNEKTVSYEYNIEDQLSKIKSGTKNYIFTYDDFFNSETIKINSNTLITNVYEEKNGNLLSSTYGNGDKVTYTYDEFDRVKTFTDSNVKYTYHYNSLGQLAIVESPDEKYRYYYDFANRLSDYVLDETLEKFKQNFEYDENGNVLSRRTYLVSTPGLSSNTVEHSSEVKCEFNKDDSVVKVTFDEGTLNYSYDYLGRLENKNISNLYNIEYKYVSLGNKTSLTVKSMKIGEDLYEYQYDDVYNITDIYLNGELVNHYEYDTLNELIQDDNYAQNKTYKFAYDKEGNILSKKEYVLGTQNLIKQDTFEYNNSSWEDQLTKYNNEAITYDAIGNPTSIGNKTLTWTNGRQLKSFSQGNKTINYTYNKDGIRTGKEDGEVYYKYYLDGTDIILEKRFSNMLYYIRDDAGALVGLKYNDDLYYYIKNLQEDIIGIMDANFNKVATYEYDSWGKILSIKNSNGVEITDKNHIAHINPFRYRSYYYDTDTGLYYLKTRYYNPEWGRFINIDTYLGVNGNILSYNLYTYVNNNPVNAIDEGGKFLSKAWKWVKKTTKKVVNTVKKVVSNVVGTVSNFVKSKKSFVAEGGVGFGLGGGGSFNVLRGEAAVYKDMTLTYSAKDNKVTSSTIGHAGISFMNLGFGNEVQHFDDRVETNGKYHDNPFISDFDIKDCPNTIVTNSLTYGDKIILEANDAPATFVGFDFNFHLGVGGHIRIGFIIENGE